MSRSKATATIDEEAISRTDIDEAGIGCGDDGTRVAAAELRLPTVEEVAGVSDRMLVRWYRLTDRIGMRSERPRYRELGPGAAAARTAFFVAVLCILVAVPVVSFLGAREESQAPGSDVPVTNEVGPEVRNEPVTPNVVEDQLPGFGVHVNQEAGFLFSYPDAWTVSDSGGTTRLLAPTSDVMITFGAAPTRPLETASDQVVAEVARSYSDVQLVASTAERTPQGDPSLVVGGKGLDAGGATVRFLVITIRGDEQTQAITVRFDAESDPLDSLSVIRQIVASFRMSDAA